jgi:hypothetical protein
VAFVTGAVGFLFPLREDLDMPCAPVLFLVLLFVFDTARDFAADDFFLGLGTGLGFGFFIGIDI